MAGASTLLMAALIAGSASAAASSPQSTAGAGAEGTEVDSVIITAERAPGAKYAPVKASLDQVQPESIVSHNFIEQITPETGNISTVIFIAPSVSGISGNAGGIGNYFSTTMRGFTDGEYNVTYDGIAFGDTNNPTHHPNDYFPTSTIGAAVVDRGPGAAGDLGQANYGGAIHYFSPDVSDTFGIQQKATWGSYGTLAGVTTLNTGSLPQLGGGKLWINLDERKSDTELSNSQGDAFNQSLKYVLPVGNKFTLTAFFEHAWSRYNFPDSSGPGETVSQLENYGKNFQLTTIPGDEHWDKWNFERKQTYFDYLDFKYELNSSISIEDEPYQYFYSNKTYSTADNSGNIAYYNPQTGQNVIPNPGPQSAPVPGVPGDMTSTLGAAQAALDNSINGLGVAQQSKNDIYGYYKRNDYNVYGDVIRFTDQLPFGVLKFGGLVEGSATYRQKAFYDFDNSTPVYLYTFGAGPNIGQKTNYKLEENSNWLQEQFFVDFNWTPINSLTVSPGFKYVNFSRTVAGAVEAYPNKTIGPSYGTNNYNSPLYFFTANYKIFPFWSVYGQFATSFLIPQLAELEVPGVTLQSLKPQTTNNYQIGTVYSRGPITADVDGYVIDSFNTNLPCEITDPSTGLLEQASCNVGNVRYSGAEGEAAYTLPFGLTFFANGSINDAKQSAQAANAATGAAASPAQEVAGVPKWTDAAGILFAHGPWHASLSYKQVGDQVVYTSKTDNRYVVPSYDTWNASAAYDFRNFEIKVQAFNLFDRRALINYAPSKSYSGPLYSTSDKTGFYEFQSGRELQVTLVARY